MMTKNEACEQIHIVLQQAVQRAGGAWRQAFVEEVRKILEIIEELGHADKGSSRG